jgi:hypothetical protein
MSNLEQLDAFDDEFSLDQELSALSFSFPEPPPLQEEEAPEVDAATRARKVLDRFPNAPNTEQVQEWIAKYGEEGVFLLALAPEDTYVMRYVKAGEHRKILQHGQAMRQRIPQEDFAAIEALEEELKFLLVKQCMLWHPQFPAPLTKEYVADSRAGLLNNLVSVVNINSYFFNDPQQVLAYTTVLRG